jgi:hypothetical protein
VRHRLHGEGETLRFDIDAGAATPAQHVLCAVYAVAEIRPSLRPSVVDASPSAAAVQRQFREMLRVAHPDHGGDVGDAASRIAELTEARRILLA